MAVLAAPCRLSILHIWKCQKWTQPAPDTFQISTQSSRGFPRLLRRTQFTANINIFAWMTACSHTRAFSWVAELHFAESWWPLWAVTWCWRTSVKRNLWYRAFGGPCRSRCCWRRPISTSSLDPIYFMTRKVNPSIVFLLERADSTRLWTVADDGLRPATPTPTSPLSNRLSKQKVFQSLNFINNPATARNAPSAICWRNGTCTGALWRLKKARSLSSDAEMLKFQCL